jgi:hypothetical protein
MLQQQEVTTTHNSAVAGTMMSFTRFFPPRAIVVSCKLRWSDLNPCIIRSTESALILARASGLCMLVRYPIDYRTIALSHE